VLHTGDIGNPVPEEHLEKLRGNGDVLFALAGAHGPSVSKTSTPP
jgi:hypothetical protein